MVAFTSWAPTVGRALSEGAEGFTQATDPESERNLKREESKLRLQEARQRIVKSQQDLLHPRPIATRGGIYEFNPETGKYEFQASPAGAGGSSDTAYIKNRRWIIDTLNDPTADPIQKRLAQGEFERWTGYKTSAEWQAYDRYHKAIERDEQPSPADVAIVMRGENRYMRQPEAGAGYTPVYPPMPGQTPPGSPGQPQPQQGAPPQAPIPGRAPAAPPTTAGPQPSPGAPVGARGQRPPFVPGDRGVPSETPQSWMAGFTQAFEAKGAEASQRDVDQLLRADPQMRSPVTQAAFTAYNELFKGPRTGRTMTVPPAQAQPPTLTPGETAKHAADTAAAQRRAAAEPTTSRELSNLTNELYPNQYFSQLEPAEKQKVLDLQSRRKQEAGFSKALRDAKGQIDELNAVDNSRRLADTIKPLLTEQNIGLKGFGNRVLNSLSQNMPFLSQEMKAQLFNKDIPRLDVLSGMITYLHAGAAKKLSGAGSMRGVTAEDMKKSEAFFNTHGMWGSAAAMQGALDAVQEIIQQVRPMVVEELVSHGIDASVRPFRPIYGHRFDETPGAQAAPPDPNQLIEGDR